MNLDFMKFNADHEIKNNIKFNPHNKPISELPKIFCFLNTLGLEGGKAYAIAEDGTCLGTHYSSHERFVCEDLGVIDGRMNKRHDYYKEYYPDGYEMIFVPSKDVENHPGIKEAYRLNQLSRMKNPVD